MNYTSRFVRYVYARPPILVFHRQSFGTQAHSAPQQTGWRKHLHRLKEAPASHITAFAILHEVTALVPLPIVYWILTVTDVCIPFPEDILAEGNRRISRLLQIASSLSGSSKTDNTQSDQVLADDSQVMLHMATAYAVVKLMMPLRIAACVFLTPSTARLIHSTTTRIFGRKGLAATPMKKA
ncbi:hypothetical protein O5D80_005857 [Batrachochytrium dendrobatidis]|nr:hypothetical protein O5D80_005857 [Batrachochytrium dendrobatidis]